MFRTKEKPAPFNYDYIIKIAFTHPDNACAPIRKIARMLGMRPGTVYRSLKRQGLVKPYSKRETETPVYPVQNHQLHRNYSQIAKNAPIASVSQIRLKSHETPMK